MGDVVDIKNYKRKDKQRVLSLPPIPRKELEPKKESTEDLDVRIARIRSSITRINQLMAELRGMSNKQPPDKDC